MTIQDCYARLGGDYQDVKGRLMSDRLIDKFLLKFPADPTMESLRTAVKTNNYPDSFRAVHTLKGVAANLSFKELQSAASNLTEQMRPADRETPCSVPADPALLAAVEEAYSKVIGVIEQYAAEKA